jgi:mRNA-degrading endonuclease HigB of HigAB toxin-antitoxin module
MFVVNNEILTKQDNKELWAWFQERINKIKKGEKRYYTFSSFKHHRYEKDEFGKKRRMRRFKTIPSFSTIDNTDLSETQTWIYVPSANAIRNENGIIRILNQKPFMISEAQMYSAERDAEIIFFLIYISEAVKNGKVHLIDTDAENIKKASEAAVASEAQYLIFSPQSPINEDTLGSDEVYRQLGTAYGVMNASTIHIAELKNTLWNNLVEFNKTRRHAKLNYEQFIKDCYNNTDTEMKSSVLLAIERDVIFFRDSAWWIKIRGEYEELIVRVAPNEEHRKNDVLISFMMQHKEYSTIVNEALENTTKRLVEVKQDIPETDPDLLNKLSRGELIKALSEIGFNGKDLFSKKNEELKEMIRNKERPVKASDV